MSKKIESMVWDITFPTQSQKLILLKLADYGNDEGASIYPARDTLAEKVGCSLATVKSALKAFRECGILTVLKEGGSGPRDTTHYGLNIELIKALSEGACTITGGSDRLEIDGYHPVEDKGPKFGQGANQGANLPPNKGPAGWPQSVKNQKLEGARARARDVDTPRAPGAEPAAARLVLQGDRNFWGHVDLARKLHGDQFARGCERDGAIVVCGDGTLRRCPPKGSATYDDMLQAREKALAPSGLTERSRAMSGDAA